MQLEYYGERHQAIELRGPGVDIVSTANAPRIAYVGQRVFWIRALSFEDFAIVLGWLDDVLPGRSDRKMPPNLGSPEAQAAIQSSVGKMVLAWLPLRHQGISFDEAAELAGAMTDLEQVRWLDVLFAHRRTKIDEPGGKDIAETWCSKGMAQLVTAIGFSEAMRLSMDQFEWLMREGDVDENPEFSSEALAARQEYWREHELPKILKLQAEQATNVN